jgi:N-acetylmuramoyl-L-alanine amidase
MAQKLKLLVIHCTATPAGRAVSSDMIRQWHLGPLRNADGSYTYKGKSYKTPNDLPKEKIGGVEIAKLQGRGWTRLGYADMIHLDGRIENLTPYNDDDTVDAWEITNGATGVNTVGRHIVYVGGTDKKGNPEDTRTQPQKVALLNYVTKLLKRHPYVKLAGHNQFAKKDCPSFSVPQWALAMGVPSKNIYTGWPDKPEKI